MKSIIWTVRLRSAPTAVRYCKRCGIKTGFVSSGVFRVNAQQKCLDVWLIYKCPACDTTWNMTVLSRVSPRAIPAALLQSFHGNDPDTAARCAADVRLIKQNGAEPGPPEIDIDGETVEPGGSVRICLKPDVPLGIRAEAVLRKKLGLSRGELEKLVSSGSLVCVSGHNLTKCKLTGEIVIELR